MIHGAAKGKPLDRAEFARRYAPVIRSYLRARWLRGPLRAEIDDAVQDVFLDCFKENGALSRADPERAGGFRAFLYGVVRIVALRAEEKRARRREVSPQSGVEIESDDESLSRIFDRAWAKAILRQAAVIQAERSEVAGRDAERRVELLRLRFAAGRAMREIAAEWQMDRRKLQYEYDKARDEFSAALCEVLRSHHPEGAVATESARLLQYFS